MGKKEEKTILKNEIDIINEKNKGFIYYTKDYFLNGWVLLVCYIFCVIWIYFIIKANI